MIVVVILLITARLVHMFPFPIQSGAAIADNTEDRSGWMPFNNDTEVTLNRTKNASMAECKLVVSKASADSFLTAVRKHRYNFVYLKLRFVNVTVGEIRHVINKNDWIWTFKGEDGAHQYLYLPDDFGYLSFGLLWIRSHCGPIELQIESNGLCPPLEVGNKYADYLIGSALMDMTSDTPNEDEDKISFWCYNQRTWIESGFVYYSCKNAICTFQTFEYSCCRTEVNFSTQNRTLNCGNEEYKFGKLWWMLPIIIGNACFAFYPVLLSNIGMKISNLARDKIDKPGGKKRLNSKDFAAKDKSSETIVSSYISSKETNPVSFLSTICSPLIRCYVNVPFITRVLRVSIILLPMVLSSVRVVLDYIYASELVKEAVRKGALLGFSSMIAGPEQARKEFLHIFGGPYVALSIYVVFGSVLIVLPSDLEEFFEKGLPDYSGKYTFIMKMPIKLKEKLSGCAIRNYTGWKRLQNILVSQIFLLLHWRFWRQCMRLFYIRWAYVLFPLMKKKLTVGPAIVIACLTIPLYTVFCLIEFIFSVSYFAFPVISCSTIVLKALIIEYLRIFQHTGFVLKIIRNVFIIPLLALFVVTWYMFCVIFFDGFWFLSKIAMFTYSGIIAYPEVSYGYFIIAFMATYYLMESFNAFGETYRHLLKMSIDCCKKYKSRHTRDSDSPIANLETIVNKRGIRRELFMHIVEACTPRRNQVMITLLKFISVLTILIISVELLKTFDKLHELSLVSHVFTVLFICALPKIFREMCMHAYVHKKQKRLKLKIYRTIAHFLKSRSPDCNFVERNVQISREDYESLTDQESDIM